MYFMGTYTPKLDDKGRLILPAKFREQLAEGLVVTQGQEKCLDVWPKADFMARGRARQGAGHDLDARGREHVRTLFASAEQGAPDKQGRISLTPPLREYAAITRDVVVIGAMDRVEIWEPTRWREYSASAQEKFAELDEERQTD